MIEKIGGWDWPDGEIVRTGEGYDTIRRPELSRINFEFLAKKANEIIEVINESRK